MNRRPKAALITLGCPKNEVDTDVLGGLLKQQYDFVEEACEADIILINTCGFVEDAKKESIDTILQAGALKKERPELKIYVWGCLAERYRGEIEKEFPEVDGFFGVESFEAMARHLLNASFSWHPSCFNNRILSTPSHTAYLKIADGCQHQCTFCAIPLFKGKTRSRTLQSIYDEAQMLADRGVLELNLVAQDTTSYGHDLCSGENLTDLLAALCTIDGIEWIRILYAHPLHVSQALIDMMASQPKICHYLDMPLQHGSDKMLRAMGRGHSRQMMTDLIQSVKKAMPDVILRTAFILGFPGETDVDFDALMEFVEDIRFDRLGAFIYSAEEGTAAFNMGPEVKRERAEARYNTLMAVQQEIAEEKNAALEGSRFPVLVDGYDEEQACFYGRMQGDAPDVDQMVWVHGQAAIGRIQWVTLTGSSAYDLEGCLETP